MELNMEEPFIPSYFLQELNTESIARFFSLVFSRK